jgi:hypothetical protein
MCWWDVYQILPCHMLHQIQSIVCFLLGDSPASEVICQRFGTLCLFYLHRQVGMEMEQTECFETLAYNYRCRWITQKKAHNIQNMTKVWNQEEIQNSILHQCLLNWSFAPLHPHISHFPHLVHVNELQIFALLWDRNFSGLLWEKDLTMFWVIQYSHLKWKHLRINNEVKFVTMSP